MKKRNVFQVFIASPSDITDEREIVRGVCRKLNESPFLKESFNISFQPVGWEDAFPSPGRPQDIFNKLVEECDVFVCLFHKKFGSPTGKAESGTLEEFLLAYDLWKNAKKPHIMLYFKNVVLDSPDDLEDPQLKSVLELKKKIIQGNICFFNFFASPEEFETKFDRHLQEWATKISRPKTRSVRRIGIKKSSEIPAIPEEYKAWILDHCRYMDISHLREKGRVLTIQLPEMYIPLYTNPLPSAPNKEKKPREIENIDDGLIDSRLQTIEKSEFLKKAGSEKPFSEEKGPVDIEDLAAQSEYLLVEGEAGSGKTTLIKHIAWNLLQNPRWKGLNEYIPILVFLKDIKNLSLRWISLSAGGKTAEKIFSAYFQMTGNGLDSALLKKYCRAGKAFFLIDGLDEIAPDLRDLFIDSLADLRLGHCPSKVVVAGRPHGIDDVVVKRFGDRHIRTLPFSEPQIEMFIQKWFDSVLREDSRIGKKTARNMISDIRAHPGIERLKDNPLMLTAICILYLDERELPEQRAELYKKFVWNLLTRRFRDPEKVHHFLIRLASKIHAGGGRGIERTGALEILAEAYPKEAGESDREYHDRLEALFDRIEPDCGLLKCEDGWYGFRHLTFQEFLMAVALIDMGTDYAKAIKKYWHQKRYKEVIELYVGYLSIDSRSWANSIVRKALEEKDRVPFYKWRLAARALLDIHKDRRELRVVDLAGKRMRGIFESNVDPKNRAEAGEILGWLGDLRDMKEFIPIEKGEYDLSRGKADIKAFEIGKFPVVNQWYKEFIDDRGYSKTEYWSEQGKKWLEKRRVTAPAFWHERRWNCPNLPVVGVTWYEAEAFVSWLKKKRKDGFVYILPSENQWEAAATGFEKRTYPWGNNWGKNMCNTIESEIGKPSSVGIFICGNTPSGIADMASNVLEWTSSDNGEQKVFQGCSWNFTQENVRCACRSGGGDPMLKYDSVGFRCARIKK